MSQPQSQPQATHKTVIRHLGGLRRLIGSLNVDGRKRLLEFWKDIRQSLNDQDATIATQQIYIAQIQQSAPTTPATRPGTSNSVSAIRQTMERDMRKKARLLTREASTAVRMIYKIDPQWALTFIKKQRDENVVHELNCWITRNASMDDDGYTIMNMRGTQIPGTKPRWNYLVRPLSRQMGIVAGGQGDKLLLTFEGGDYVVTHLCRNKACFNPEHLLVETKEQKELRKTCHESFVIRTADGTVIHPCTHWMGGARVQCVLPVRDVPAPAVGKYVDMSLGGPVLRTGRSNQ